MQAVGPAGTKGQKWNHTVTNLSSCSRLLQCTGYKVSSAICWKLFYTCRNFEPETLFPLTADSTLDHPPSGTCYILLTLLSVTSES